MSQVWLITGASRGLGWALAEAALGAGHQVLAGVRRPERLADAERRYGDRIRVQALDVTDPAAAKAAVEATTREFGRLDVLVNNAGYGDVGSVEDTPLEEIRAQIETNLFGVIWLTKAAIPVMREQRAGRIIQISSVGGRVGAMGRAAYSAAKWGVEGFSEAVSREIAPLGVKLTIIEPGGFRTEFAGVSTKLSPSSSAYDATVGAAVRFQRDFNGKQPGDPSKAAAVILQIAHMEKPPLRLLLGSDAVRIVEEADRMKTEADRRWRNLSISTDFAARDP